MIFNRVKKILLLPKEAWAEINVEDTSIQGLFYKYAMYLALIPSIALVVGFSIVGMRFGPTYYRMPLMTALFSAIVSYIINLAGVFVGGYIINFLGQYFSAESTLKQAMKLSVYSSTAFWVAAIFGVLPSLGLLSILGLYSVYLLYVGVPILIKIPEDKVMPYTVSVIVSLIVLGFLLNAVVGQFVYAPIYSELLTY